MTDQVSPGNYEIKVKTAATQAEVTSGADFNSTAAIGVSGTMSVNGSTVEIAATDTYQEVYEKLRTAGEIKQWIYGSQQTDASGKTTTSVPNGSDMELDDVANWKGFTSSATAKCDGNRVTITDLGGFSLSFLVEAGYEDGATKTDSAGNVLETYDGSLKFEVTDMGTMTLHIGANMDQNMNIRIPEISCESLYIDDLDVTTVNGADRALDRLDDAIARVSETRSNLGAYENRLEYSTNSLDEFGENMTDAMSRLTDVDMAEEMTNYTHQNVLNQAAISVLTQANDLPQQVLQILQ